jgi:hypothetical protein
MRTAIWRLLGAGIMVGCLLASVATAAASGFDGILVYTRYGTVEGGLRSVTYNYDGSTFGLGTPRSFSSLAVGDGLAYTPSGRILVGSSDDGTKMNLVDPSTAAVQIIDAGVPVNHIAVDPSGAKAYGTSYRQLGSVAQVGLDPFAPLTPATVSGDEKSIVSIAFGTDGTGYYTTGAGGFASAKGTLGVVDPATFTTTRKMNNIDGDHGMVFDTFTGDLITFGDDVIQQIDPATFTIVSTLTIPNTELDQGSTDGRGHLFAGDNNGTITFVDYSRTHAIGTAGNFVKTVPLETHVDDVAPLVHAPPPPYGPAGNPLGLPKKHQCVKTHRLKLAIRPPSGQVIIAADVYVNSKRRSRVEGDQITRVVVKRLPHRRFKLKVVGTNSIGGKLISAVRYRGCRS